MEIEEFKNVEDVKFLEEIKGCQPISTKNGTHSLFSLLQSSGNL